MSEDRRLRVVHVVGAMNRAGVETWLMNVARRLPPEKVEMVFVVHSAQPSDYDDEIRSLGHTIAVCAQPRSLVAYGLRLARVYLSKGRRADAVHAHVGSFSAVSLFVAWLCGVRIRIAHSHSDNRVEQRRASRLRRTYLAVTSLMLRAMSTSALASSAGACYSLFRRPPRPSGKYSVLPTGIDLETFVDVRGGLREELQIPDSARVIGHIGRFVPVKNHALLVAMGKVLAETDVDWRLLLVGAGPLRSATERDVRAAGLTERIRFLGTRSDIPEVLDACDMVILPSFYEGVPITLLEAQASGRPCVISSRVTTAADVVPELITRLDPEEHASVWATACLRALARPVDTATRAQALNVMRESDYNLDVTVRRLLDLWSSREERS